MIVKCQQCEATIELNESVSKDFKYTCRKHVPEPDENSAGMANTQFDERFRKGHWSPPQGFQMAYEACPYDTFIPDWAKTDDGIQKIIRTVFPKFETNENQNFRAGKWAAVAYLFWRVQFTDKDIAEELGIPLQEVIEIIRRIRRVAVGKTTGGYERLKAKKRSTFRLN